MQRHEDVPQHQLNVDYHAADATIPSAGSLKSNITVEMKRPDPKINSWYLGLDYGLYGDDDDDDVFMF